MAARGLATSSRGEEDASGSYEKLQQTEKMDQETKQRNSKTIEELIDSLIERDSTDTTAAAELNAQFYSIILPVFFFFFTLFSMIPLTYQVIVDQTCISLSADDCSDSEVSSKASLTVLYANTATYLPGLLTTGFYSSVANTYGRKIVMVISLIGVVLYALLFAYVVFEEPTNFKEVIIIASFLMGVTGTYATFMMGAFSFVADTTPPSVRNKAYRITESCLYIGKIIGPITSGLWAQSYGFRIPFLAAAIAAALCIFYIVLFVEESLFSMQKRQSTMVTLRSDSSSSAPLSPSNEDDSTAEKKLEFNPMQTYHNLKLLFGHEVVGGGRSPVPYIAVAFFFFHFSLMGFMQVVYVYMKYEYDWGSLLIGLYDSINGIMQASSMLFAPAIVHSIIRQKLHLSTWIMIGYVLRSFHWFALAALAFSTATVFAILPINFLSGLVIPYTRVLLSNSVQPENQAQMFAGLSGIESIGTLLSPLFSLGYSLTVGNYGEAMFLVMSILTACSALIIFHIRSKRLLSSEQSMESHTPTDDNITKDSALREGLLRQYSVGSHATYGDRQMSFSVGF